MDVEQVKPKMIKLLNEFISLKTKSIQLVKPDGAPVDFTIKPEMSKNMQHYSDKLVKWAGDPVYTSSDLFGYANELFLYAMLKLMYPNFDVLPTPPFLDFPPHGATYSSADLMIGVERDGTFMPLALVSTAMNVLNTDNSVTHALVGCNCITLNTKAYAKSQNRYIINDLVEFGISEDPMAVAEKLLPFYMDYLQLGI